MPELLTSRASRKKAIKQGKAQKRKLESGAKKALSKAPTKKKAPAKKKASAKKKAPAKKKVAAPKRKAAASKAKARARK